MWIYVSPQRRTYLSERSAFKKQGVVLTGRNTTGLPWSVTDADRRQQAKQYWPIRQANNNILICQRLMLIATKLLHSLSYLVLRPVVRHGCEKKISNVFCNAYNIVFFKIFPVAYLPF